MKPLAFACSWLLAIMMSTAHAQNPLSGTSWNVTSLLGQPVLAESNVSLAFDDSGNVSGNSGVNMVGGAVAIDGDKITFDQLRSTRRAASQELMEQEMRFTRALSQTASFRRDPSNKLVLLDASGTPLLEALAATP